LVGWSVDSSAGNPNTRNPEQGDWLEPKQLFGIRIT
jgi:hypothetical protein